MPVWLSAIGAFIAVCTTVLIVWSVIDPGRKLVSVRIDSPWLQLFSISCAVLYVVWISTSFLNLQGPIGLWEMFNLILSGTVVLILTFALLVRVWIQFTSATGSESLAKMPTA